MPDDRLRGQSRSERAKVRDELGPARRYDLVADDGVSLSPVGPIRRPAQHLVLSSPPAHDEPLILDLVDPAGALAWEDGRRTATEKQPEADEK